MSRIVPNTNRAWSLLGALFLLLAGAGGTAAQQYEHPADQRAAQVLPSGMVQGPHYQLQNPVVSDGYMYRFSVKSDYGPFEVTGLGALRKLETEIQAIAKLKEIKAGKAFGKAVVDSATGPFQLIGHLVTHPVDTVTGVPKGAWKVMEDAGESITTERNPSDDPMYAKFLLMSGNKRNYASQLGVDVYSRNPVLQKELNGVGWAAAVGNLTVSAALMPVGGPAGAALSLTRWSNALNDYVKQEPVSRLRIISEEKLKASGVSSDLAGRFLNNPAFTPRQWIIISEALARLGPAPANGRDSFLEVALRAQDDVEADFFTNTAQILRGYHEGVSPITGIQMLGGRLVAAQAQSGNALVPVPADYLIWTQTVQKRAQGAKTTYQAPGFNGKLDLWLTGKASAMAKQNLAALGLIVTEEVGKRVEIVD